MKMKIGIALLVAIAIIASLHLYFIRDSVDGTALWNSSEAYFFIGVHAHGLHVSLLGIPRLFVTQLLRGVELPDDDRISWVIVRATSSEVERHIVKQEDPDPGRGPTMFTPRGDRIYVNYPACGGLCIWAGDHFDLAPQEERRGFNGIGFLTMRDFENKNGWSKRRFGDNSTDSNFTI
jgi:hypothetical protein